MTTKQKLNLIKRLISQSDKNTEKENNFLHWLTQKEYLLILTLLVTQTKPGATLPKEFFNQKDLNQCLDLINQLDLIAKPTKFKNYWLVTVAKNKKHFELFNSNNFGKFYGYPQCCINEYKLVPKKSFSIPPLLNFVGLIPCHPNCPKANKLAQKYLSCFEQVLSTNKFKQLQSYLFLPEK